MQDLIGIAGGMPNMYSYVKDLNHWVDLLGLMAFNPIPITEGFVFRGIEPGGANNYSPDIADLNGHTDGISTKPPKSHGGLSTSDENFLRKGGKGIDKIDAGKLTKGGNLVVIKDGKSHASIMPSDSYLAKNYPGMERSNAMKQALEDWHKGGDDHILSKEIKNAASCH